MARDFILNIASDGLSPGLNYVVLLLTLPPILVLTAYA
jgi:hypothetical protein